MKGNYYMCLINASLPPSLTYSLTHSLTPYLFLPSIPPSLHPPPPPPSKKKKSDFNYVKEKDLNLSCIHGNADRASAVPHSYMYYTQCYYEAFVRLYVLEHLGMSSSGFRVPESKWGLAAPTWEDDSYRHILMQVRARKSIVHYGLQ